MDKILNYIKEQLELTKNQITYTEWEEARREGAEGVLEDLLEQFSIGRKQDKPDKELIAHYKKSQVWYVKALEALSPLRFHMDELIKEIEMHNRFLKKVKVATVPSRRIKAAKRALAKAEKFFCNKAP